MICILFSVAALAIATIMHSGAEFTLLDTIAFAFGVAFFTVAPSCYIQYMKSRIDELNEENKAIKNALKAIEKEVFEENNK